MKRFVLYYPPRVDGKSRPSLSGAATYSCMRLTYFGKNHKGNVKITGYISNSVAKIKKKMFLLN